MLLYVHSAGRGHLPLPTLDTLLASKHANIVRLVVQAAEVRKYAPHINKLPDTEQLIVLPPKIKRLSPTRQWLLENCPSNKMILFDDDLAFAVRRKDDITKFRPAEPADITRMIDMLHDYLDRYVHVGLMAREGGNRIKTDAKGKPVKHLEAIRMMRVLGYNRGNMCGAPRFDRLPTKQDFDMTLQLLRTGYPNAVITEFVHNQAGSNTEGGCSAYRDEAMMARSAELLRKLHPDYVKVVTKETKSAWGGGERVDVQISWKKALANG
jgi:hypothetical protein